MESSSSTERSCLHSANVVFSMDLSTINRVHIEDKDSVQLKTKQLHYRARRMTIDNREDKRHCSSFLERQTEMQINVESTANNEVSVRRFVDEETTIVSTLNTDKDRRHKFSLNSIRSKPVECNRRRHR